MKIAEGTPVEVKTSIENDFKMTPQQLEEAITPQTKMLWFSSPCNPSGSLYSTEELRALADVLQKHPQIIVVSDEIYEHINLFICWCSFCNYRANNFDICFNLSQRDI